MKTPAANPAHPGPVVRLGVRPPRELVESTTFLLKRLGWAVKDRTFAAFEEAGESPYHYSILAVLEESARETQHVSRQRVSVRVAHPVSGA